MSTYVDDYRRSPAITGVQVEPGSTHTRRPATTADILLLKHRLAELEREAAYVRAELLIAERDGTDEGWGE